MALPLTVTAVALFYLSAIPIQMAFFLRYDGALRVGARETPLRKNRLQPKNGS